MRAERLAEASSRSFSVDQADLDFIPRAKGSDVLRFGFQKDPFGCSVEDRSEEGKGGSREDPAEASALVKVRDGKWE